MPSATSDLGTLNNIGKTIERRLNEVGIFSRRDLKRVGPARAYQRIVSKNPGKTIAVCYYLYSLEGALTDTHWDSVPDERKRALRRAGGRA